jgi:hypothetical protein
MNVKEQYEVENRRWSRRGDRVGDIVGGKDDG